MGLKYCTLRDKTQRKRLEYFVLEVTARAAADLLGLQANTAALFYRTIRLIIAENLAAAASEVAGEIEWDERYFGGVRKEGNEAEVLRGKFPYWGA